MFLKTVLHRFEEYCVETMRKRGEESKSSEDTILRDLSKVFLQSRQIFKKEMETVAPWVNRNEKQRP